MNASDDLRQPLPPEQVGTLARQYGRTVLTAAYRVLGNTSQAEEVQQEVFLRLLEKPVGEVASWPAFLAAMAMRMAIDRLRRGARWRRLLPLWRGDAAASPARPDELLEQQERAARLRAALARLPATQAQVFTLRCAQGLDLAAIAAATGMSVNNVSVSLHRAVRALEARLGAVATSINTLPET